MHLCTIVCSYQGYAHTYLHKTTQAGNEHNQIQLNSSAVSMLFNFEKHVDERQKKKKKNLNIIHLKKCPEPWKVVCWSRSLLRVEWVHLDLTAAESGRFKLRTLWLKDIAVVRAADVTFGRRESGLKSAFSAKVQTSKFTMSRAIRSQLYPSGINYFA